MRAPWLFVLLLLLVGCARSVLGPLDASLPESRELAAPGEPLEVLLQAAGNLDPTPRARALGLLVRASAEPAGGEFGLRALFDPEPWVQRAGVEALGARLVEPESVAALETYVGREGLDPYVRGRAGLLLARAGHRGTAQTLSAAWRAETADWRRAPLLLAALAMGDEAALEPLGAALRRGELALETDFVLDLGRSGHPELIAGLREGDTTVEPEMRLPYAAARMALGDGSADAVLRRALASDEVEERLEALDYLSRLREPGASALLQRAHKQRTELVRWYAALALAARGQGDPERFERGAAHPDREVRALAQRFLAEAAGGSAARRVDRVARRVVSVGLQDEDPSVRMEALRALTVLGWRGPADALADNLADDYLIVRVEAAGAMLLLRADSQG